MIGKSVTAEAIANALGKSMIIGEVPLRSFMDTEKRLPLWMWNILGRVQWYIGSSRQLEKRNSTIQRAKKLEESL